MTIRKSWVKFNAEKNGIGGCSNLVNVNAVTSIVFEYSHKFKNINASPTSTGSYERVWRGLVEKKHCVARITKRISFGIECKNIQGEQKNSWHLVRSITIVIFLCE